MENNNTKIIVCNIIVVVLAIVSIVTIWTGNFFALTVTFNFTEESLSKFAKEAAGEEGNEDIEKYLKGVNAVIPLSVRVRSKTLIGSISDTPQEAVSALMSDQLDTLVGGLLKGMGSIIEAFARVMVNTVAEEAKDAIKKELGVGATDEQIASELESQHGITEEDIDTLVSDVADTLIAMLDSDTSNASEPLKNSQTLDKLFGIYAEEALKEDNGEGSYTQAQIDAKAEELKDEFIQEYESKIEEMAPEGELNGDSVVIGIFNNAFENQQFENLDDVKEYLSQVFAEAADEDTAVMITKVMRGFGAFLLVVIAAWAYVALKILIKLFARNKTVGMFFPKFFGWMPYVIFVGIPTILYKSMGAAINKFGANLGVDAETVSAVTEYSNLATIKFSALTWVSALCALFLMILWFPYHRWRKQEKLKKKGGAQ